MTRNATESRAAASLSFSMMPLFTEPQGTDLIAELRGAQLQLNGLSAGFIAMSKGPNARRET
jgi:hypothetical protein